MDSPIAWKGGLPFLKAGSAPKVPLDGDCACWRLPGSVPTLRCKQVAIISELERHSYHCITFAMNLSICFYFLSLYDNLLKMQRPFTHKRCISRTIILLPGGQVQIGTVIQRDYWLWLWQWLRRLQLLSLGRKQVSLYVIHVSATVPSAPVDWLRGDLYLFHNWIVLKDYTSSGYDSSILRLTFQDSLVS